jgi:hypothetical protein
MCGEKGNNVKNLPSSIDQIELASYSQKVNCYQLHRTHISHTMGSGVLSTDALGPLSSKLAR